jgi:predicted transcriptional regulator
VFLRAPKRYTEELAGVGATTRDAGVRRKNAARVAELIMRWGWVQGTQARIARELGVSEATISRDMRRIYAGPDRNKLLLQRTIAKALKKATRKLGYTAT